MRRQPLNAHSIGLFIAVTATIGALTCLVAAVLAINLLFRAVGAL